MAALRAVHEAALVPETWPTALDAIAAACRANVVAIQSVGPEGHIAVMTPNAEALARDYFAAGWHVNDPRMERGIALAKRGFRGLVTEWHSFTQEELARLPYQQEFAARYGIEHEAGIMLGREADTRLVLTILRSAKPGPFHGRELEQMNDLVAKLAGAFSFALRFKLGSAKAMAETIGSMGKAVALLTATGRILHLTNEFEANLPCALTVRNGRFRAVRAFEDSALQSLISQAAAQSGFAGDLPPVIIRREGGVPLLVRCLPVAGAARDILGLARVILALDDASASSPAGTVEHLINAFGLTPAEARFASRIGAGETVSNASEAERIGVETARKRLKTIFRKTDTRRQAELALLISRFIS